jgi:hypothetical protein
MRAATGVRSKLVSHPMNSFHAPISQTLISLKRQHSKIAMRPLLFGTELSQTSAMFTRPRTGLMQRARVFIIALVTQSIAIDRSSIQIPNEICCILQIGDCKFSISRRMRKAINFMLSFACEARGRKAKFRHLLSLG